jgi:hypothetical protein
VGKIKNKDVPQSGSEGKSVTFSSSSNTTPPRTSRLATTSTSTPSNTKSPRRMSANGGGGSSGSGGLISVGSRQPSATQRISDGGGEELRVFMLDLGLSTHLGCLTKAEVLTMEDLALMSDAVGLFRTCIGWWTHTAQLHTRGGSAPQVENVPAASSPNRGGNIRT